MTTAKRLETMTASVPAIMKAIVTPSGTDALRTAVRRWLCWDDMQLLDLLIATHVSVDMKGDPVWVLLLKPSSGGGTEILRAFQDDKVFPLSSLTPQSLISGLRPEPGAKAENLDLMNSFNGKSVILKDFSTVLSLQKDDLRRVLADLREAYDGSLVKAFGSVGVKKADAHFNLIAAVVTQAAEKHRRVMAPLGERFIWLRYHPDPDVAVSQAFDGAENEEEMRADLAQAMGTCCEEARLRLPDVRRTSNMKGQLVALASLTASLRTPVDRDYAGMLQVDTEPEIGARLVKVYRKLSVALAAVNGVVEPGRKELDAIMRAAHDTIPQFRRQLVSAVVRQKTITYEELAEQLNMPKIAIRRECEELAVLGVFGIVAGPKLKRVSLTRRVAGWWKEARLE